MTFKNLAKVLSPSLVVVLMLGCSEKELVLKPQVILLKSVDQIVPITDSLVRPILYQNFPDFNELPVQESKKHFISIVLPAVLIARYNLNQDRKWVDGLSEKITWKITDSLRFEQLKSQFNAQSITDLQERMAVHPNSITLAQAIVESGWGSSRFFKEGNNLFGIWAYRADEPRIPANESGVYLRRYDDISQSITDYYLTLGRAKPYQEFRKARLQYTAVEKLLPHLKYYSERGTRYIDQLATIIRQNNLTQYDDYRLHPDYFFEQ